MHYRIIAILVFLGIAFGGGGCASKSNKDYDEVLMPLQTGSVLQRRVRVPVDAAKKKKPETKKSEKKKPAPTPKPESERAETPPPVEEATPAPERFR